MRPQAESGLEIHAFCFDFNESNHQSGNLLTALKQSVYGSSWYRLLFVTFTRVIKPCLQCCRYNTESVCVCTEGCVGVCACVSGSLHTSVTPHWPPLHYLATCNIKHVTNTAHHTTQRAVCTQTIITVFYN